MTKRLPLRLQKVFPDQRLAFGDTVGIVSRKSYAVFAIRIVYVRLDVLHDLGLGRQGLRIEVRVGHVGDVHAIVAFRLFDCQSVTLKGLLDLLVRPPVRRPVGVFHPLGVRRIFRELLREMPSIVRQVFTHSPWYLLVNVESVHSYRRL